MALWTSVDEAAGKPKNLTSTEKLDVYGISTAEATTPSNIAKGLNTPGWVKYTTYEDAQENVRHKVEVLVAMGTISDDAADDSVAADPVITIATQPANATVADEETATFTVVASVSNGGTLTYQWQNSVDSGSTFEDIEGATSASFDFDAGVANDGDQFRVVVSSTGAANVTSTAATLTVTA